MKRYENIRVCSVVQCNGPGDSAIQYTLNQEIIDAITQNL